MHNVQCHVEFRDEDSGAQISLSSTLCWFSAFLNITYSTCLDCTLPVTRTFCFTLMFGFTLFMITEKHLLDINRKQHEFLFFFFITLYQRLVSYAFS